MFKNLPLRLIDWFHNARDVLRFAIRRGRDERIAQVASSLTFTSILSLVPLFTIVGAVLTALPIFDQMQINLREWMGQNLIPGAISDTIFRYLNQFASKARGLTLVGVLILVVTALSTVLTIDRALNKIWRVRRPRSLSRRVLVYWAVLTVGPILLASSLTLTTYLVNASGGMGKNSPFLLRFVADWVPLMLMTVAYASLYVYVPNRYVAWRDALIGGFCAALAFELIKRGFASYFSHFRSFTAIYGALSALPIFLLWIYLSWLITLLGATIAASLPTLYERNWNRGTAPGQDFADALRILRALHLARQKLLPGLTGHEIREKARLGWDQTDHFLHQLEAEGLIVRSRLITSRGSTRTAHDDLWLFAADSQTVKLERLFRLFAFDGKRVARVGLAMDDPLAETLRSTQPVNGELSLSEAWNS